jgi:hypothetical protein
MSERKEVVKIREENVSISRMHLVKRIINLKVPE